MWHYLLCRSATEAAKLANALLNKYEDYQERKLKEKEDVNTEQVKSKPHATP